MIAQEFKLQDALGAYLFQPIYLGDIVLEKGHLLQAEDLIQLQIMGVEKIFAVKMEEGDLRFDTALGIICAKLCGNNTAYEIGSDGICRIVSTIDGVFMVNDERVSKFNRYNHNVILNIYTPYAFVQANDIIAELELTVPFLRNQDVEDIIYRLSGNVDMLTVHDVSQKTAGLMYTRFYNNQTETQHFTQIVQHLVKDFPHMDMNFVREVECPHTQNDIANTLQRSLKDKIDILFILGGQRNSCQQDIMFQALQSFVDEIVCPYLPQTGSSDLIIASKRDKKIIVIPYDFDNLPTEYLERYIVQAIVADKLNVFDFNHPQNYILPASKLPQSQHLIGALPTSQKQNYAGIAAVVLAAGPSRRAGRNKLLTEIDEKPLFINALQAAVKSKASPVFLITGYQAEELEEYIQDIDVNVIYNSDYRSGVRTSIDIGVKSVPSFCEGVMLIPADMPNLTAEYLNSLIDCFKKGEGRQMVCASHNGIKCNPIIWGKDLYDNADLVPENADLRAVFIEHSDYTTLLPTDNQNLLVDVNYPNDIEVLYKQHDAKSN